MKSRIVTVVPYWNGGRFIRQALESVARQDLRPDRVVLLDDASTEPAAPAIAGFDAIQVEVVRNPENLGLFGNCNQALGFASETDYLHILHQDDLIEPTFYGILTRELESCDGHAMVFCLDERIDENGRRLSVSGRADGSIRVLDIDDFLRRKAEISNQAFSGTLLKSCGREAPCRFRTDLPILADVVYWADWARHCGRIVQVKQALSKYRWHGDNATTGFAQDVDALIVDEWRAMQIVEAFRARKPGLLRKLRLKGLLAVRSGIKAKRVRQNGNAAYAAEIVRAARAMTGWPLWLAGRALVELRDLLVFRLGRRPRHPKNIYS